MAGRQSAPRPSKGLTKQPVHIGLVIPHGLLFFIPASGQIGLEGLQGADLGLLGGKGLDTAGQVVLMISKGEVGFFLGALFEFVQHGSHQPIGSAVVVQFEFAESSL